MSVALTILEQLGGRRFLVMTGAKSLAASESSLSMRLDSVNDQGHRIRAVRIDLDPSDTYTLTAYGPGKEAYDVVERYRQSDVYCDVLQDVFTRATGLYTSL
jgi:hypothetical protein